MSNRKQGIQEELKNPNLSGQIVESEEPYVMSQEIEEGRSEKIRTDLVVDVDLFQYNVAQSYLLWQLLQTQRQSGRCIDH